MSHRVARLAELAERRPPQVGHSRFALGLDQVESGSGRLVERWTSEVPREGTKFSKGDVLFGKLRPYLAKAWVSDEPGVYVGDFICLRPSRATDPRFLSYLLRSREFIDRCTAEAHGSKMPRVEWSRVKSFPVPAPSPAEQRSIADYLDHETAEIDAFIAHLNGMQELLNEDLESRVHAAVTGRLMPRDSFPTPGPEWAGDLPKGWTVPRLSWLFSRIGSGTTPRSDDADAYGRDIPWVTTGELRERAIGQTQRNLSREALGRYTVLEVFPEGSLLIAMYGATIGRLGWLSEPAAVNQAVCAMSGYAHGDFRYMFYVLSAARSYLRSRAVGGGQPNINQEMIRALRVPLPPEAEQKAIVSELDRSMQSVQEMAESSHDAIALAKERRAALISRAVTGQIDVTKKSMPMAEQLEDEVREMR